jgi:hypothetical protein
VTGNGAGTDFAIGAVNAFNLGAAATAPLFIFPRLGLSGAAAWLGLVWVPLVFSTLFFGVPLLRWAGVKRENRVREQRNLRKVLLSHVFRASLVGDGAQAVTVEGARAAAAGLAKKQPSPREVEAELVRLTADWDATVSAGEGGRAEYRFDQIRAEFQGAEEVRRQLSLESRQVGEIVYSSADSSVESSERDARAFDRELAGAAAASDSHLGAGASLRQYLPPADRVAYVDDFELVAFDEEVKRRAGVSRAR